MDAISKSKNVDMVGHFRTMVKSGETYFSSDLHDDQSGFFEHDSRPRNIAVPSPKGCGILTAVQSLLWAPIKQFLPGFI